MHRCNTLWCLRFRHSKVNPTKLSIAKSTGSGPVVTRSPGFIELLQHDNDAICLCARACTHICKWVLCLYVYIYIHILSFVCTYIYICTCTDVCICIYIYMHTYFYVYVYVYCYYVMCVYIHMYIGGIIICDRVKGPIYTHISINAYTHTYSLALLSVCVCSTYEKNHTEQPRIHTCTHTHIYIYMYIYVHVRMSQLHTLYIQQFTGSSHYTNRLCSLRIVKPFNIHVYIS